MGGLNDALPTLYRLALDTYNSEGDALVDTQAMADALTDCGLPVHLEVWGSDVSHDWYWWGKEFGMFAERLFG